MDVEGDSVTWELSKENIQPLKHGRNASVLSVALDDSASQKLGIIKHGFEEELRTYSGDDPLDVWYRYALWVEQNFPKGGKDGNLKKIIQKCVTSILTNSETCEKYRNDPRYFALWVKYANIIPNSLEVYTILESKGLCTGLSEYYINWSWEYEIIGNFSRADAIYQKAFEAGATPLDVLNDAHKKFQTRVVRATVDGKVAEIEPETTDGQRVALAALKVEGKKNRVAHERVGSSVLGPAGRVPQTQPASNTGAPVFNIFQDDGQKSAASSVGSTVKGGALPIKKSVNKENIKDPTQWTKAKVGQKTTGVVPVEDVAKFQKPEFSVHVDQETSQYGKTPSKLPETSNVLSVLKNLDHVPLFIPEPFDPKVQPQYCKHKVYCGTEEFSFEELRAVKYMKRDKEEAERKQAEKEKDNHIQVMQEMLSKQEKMIQQLMQMNSKQTAEAQQAQARDRSNFQDSWISMNKSVTASVNASTANVSHFLDESSTRALLQLKPATLTPISGEVSEDQEEQHDYVSSSRSDQDTSSNSNSNSRGLNLTDPTVNTKMAMNAINEMWSASLFKDDSIAVDVDTDPAPAKESVPFSIFQDDVPTKQMETAPPTFSIYSDGGAKASSEVKSTMPFPIFEDEPLFDDKASVVTDADELYPENQNENMPPKGYTVEKNTRPLAGVLQPAVNIPVCAVEEEEEEEAEEEKATAKEDNAMYDEVIDTPANYTVMADFTLKMPNNPEAFAKDAKVASTPAWFMNQGAKGGDDNTMGALLKDGNFFPIDEDSQEEEEENKEGSGELMPPPSITCPPASPPECSAKPALSPIMEASREYRSSSSSSGYSTTSSVLGSYSVNGVTNCGPLSTTQASRSRHFSNTQSEWACEIGSTSQAADFTKSGYLADKSRGESLADSRPINSVSQSQTKTDDMFDPHQAAMMLMEMDKFSVTTSSVKGEQREKRSCNVVKTNKADLPEHINPFDEELLQMLLNNLNESVEKRGGYVTMNGKVPLLKPNMQVTLGQEMFHVRCLRGEGAYAKAFQAVTLDPLNVTVFPTQNSSDDEEDEDDEHQMILKIQKPSCPWEFYICHELRNRLKVKSFSTNMLDSMMRINRGYFYSNGSILVNQYHKYGTLLDVVNGYKADGQAVPERIVMYFMIEVISVVEALHSCNIIHADIKPDNFLVRDIPSFPVADNAPEEIFKDCPSVVKLIDFGRSIDMELFPQGTTFTEKVKTEGFTCCEMKEGKPWTYHTDYYGIAAIAYCFLFSSYMEVKKTPNGKWELKGVTMKRYWQRDLWQSFFSTLLNSPSLDSLKQLKEDLMSRFIKLKMYKEINIVIKKLASTLIRKK